MALLDSFSGMSLSGVNSSSLLDMAKTAGLTKLGALGGATSTTGQSPATATKSYYKVVIQAQTDNAGVINITADCPAEFAFDTAVDYDSPYQNFIEDSVMAASPDKIKGLAYNANDNPWTNLAMWKAASSDIFSGSNSCNVTFMTVSPLLV